MNHHNKLDWIGNKEQAKALVDAVGARSLTYIQPVIWFGGKKGWKMVLHQYSKMVEYGDKEANKQTKLWINRVSKLRYEVNDSYIYFNIVRY